MSLPLPASNRGQVPWRDSMTLIEQTDLSAFEAEWNPLETEGPVDGRFCLLFEQVSESSISTIDTPRQTQPKNEEPSSAAGSEVLAGEDSAFVRYEKEIDHIRNAHLKELQDLRAAHAVELSQAVVQSSENLILQLTGEISGRVSRILHVALGVCIQKASIEAISHELGRILTDKSATQVRLSGPVELVEKVAAALGGERKNLFLDNTPSIDVIVAFDREVISTRLDEWGRGLLDLLK